MTISDPTNIHSIVPAKTDADHAKEYRARLAPLLEQCAAIMSEARANGYEVGFGIAPDNFGRHRPSPITVTKPL